MRIFRALTLWTCLVPLLHGPAAAEDDSTATDRPDFVESSDVVGKGRVQIETSLAWERDRQGGKTSRLRGTPTLLRIGLNDALEFRLETDRRLQGRFGDDSTTVYEAGWGDEDKGTPGMAWLFHADVDSGSYRGQGIRPSVRFVAEWELPGGLSVGVMPGLYQERNEAGGRYVGAVMAGVIGKPLAERLRGFAELSAQKLTSARNGGNVITADISIAYLLTRDLQVDTAVSRGVNRNSPDWG